jgi:hypothetical protein
MIILPRKIYLTALNKHWNVSYIKSHGKLTILECPNHKLTIYGRNYSKRAALQLITRWLRLKASIYLNAELIKMNRKIKANYKKLIIRSVETQWGSYSSSKTISLNYKLIFLPPSLIKHLLIHELCHVRHLNHSAKFWEEVQRFDKDWGKNRVALQDAMDYVPRWVIF